MSPRIVRKVLEVIAAGALIVAIFVWPHSRTGWFIQISSAVIAFACIALLKKWPSA